MAGKPKPWTLPKRRVFTVTDRRVDLLLPLWISAATLGNSCQSAVAGISQNGRFVPNRRVFVGNGRPRRRVLTLRPLVPPVVELMPFPLGFLGVSSTLGGGEGRELNTRRRGRT